MNWKVLFKITTLLTALVATVYSIYLLNSGHTTDFLNSLGFSGSGKTLHWCTDRLDRAEGLDSQWTLHQVDRKWIVKNNSDQEMIVASLDVEKWLAQYCMIDVRPYPREKILETQVKPFLKMIFNDNHQILIYQKDMQVFQMNEQTFESDDLKNGLIDLIKLLGITHSESN